MLHDVLCQYVTACRLCVCVRRTTARDLFRSPEPQASTPRKLTRCGRRPSALPNEIDGLSLTGDGPTQIRPRSSPLVTTW